MATEEKVRIIIEGETSDINKATAGARKGLEGVEQATENVSTSEKKRAKEKEKAKKIQDKENESIKNTISQLEKLGISTKSLTKEQLLQVNITKKQNTNLNLVKDSYNKTSAQINLSEKVLKSLTSEQVKNIKVGGKLKTTINAQKDSLKKFDDEIGNNFRKVGGYTKAIQDAFRGQTAALKTTQSQLQSAGKEGQSYGIKMRDSFLKAAVGIAAGVVAFKAVFAAGKAVINTTREWMNLSNIQETAVKRLNFQLGDNAQKYIDMAGELQNVTKFGDEAIISMQSYATALGASEPNLEQITESSLGLSTALGLDLNTAARMATSAIQDQDYTLLNRYLPALKSANTEAEKAAIFQEATSKGFALAKEEAKAGAGALEQYSNTYGDFQEVLGDLVKQVLVPMLPALTGVVNGFSSFFGLFKTEKNVVQESVIKFQNLSDVYLSLKKQTKLTADEHRVLAITIKSLQTEYPSYLKNIDLEKTGYKDVKSALEDINIELKNKLITQLKEKEITALRTEQINLELAANKLIENKIIAQANFDRVRKEANLTEKEANNLVSEFYTLSQNSIRQKIGDKDATYELQTALVALSTIRSKSNNDLEANNTLQTENKSKIDEVSAAYNSLNIEIGKGSEDSEGEDIGDDGTNPIIDAKILEDEQKREIDNEYYIFRVEKADELFQYEVEKQNEMVGYSSVGLKKLESDAKKRDKLAAKSALIVANGMGNIFASMVSGEEKAGEAVVNGVITTLQAVIAAYVAAEVGKATTGAPMSFGATLLAIAPIIAAGGIATGALEAIKFADGGVLEGPSHAQGGIKVGGNQEVEGGEIILTKKASLRPDLLQRASDINIEAGGRSLTGKPSPSIMESGGIVTNTNNNNASIDLSAMVTRMDITNMLLAQHGEKLSNIESKTGIFFDDDAISQLTDSIDQSAYEATTINNQDFQTIGK